MEVNDNQPAWFGARWNVPPDVATCPECGAKLTAQAMAWDELTGQPIGSDLQVDCVKDINMRHRWWQSDWQPVLDAIRKWCDATKD